MEWNETERGILHFAFVHQLYLLLQSVSLCAIIALTQCPAAYLYDNKYNCGRAKKERDDGPLGTQAERASH